MAVRPDTATLAGTRSRTRSRVADVSGSAGRWWGSWAARPCPRREVRGSPTMAMPGSAANALGQRRDGLGVHAGAAQVGDEQQRGVEARAEAVGQQVVGAAVGGAGRVVAGVREARLHLQRRGGQREQHRRGDGQVRPRPARHAVGEAPPGRVLGRSLRGAGADQPPGVDAVAEQRQQRRQQREGGRHGEEHDQRGAEPDRGQEAQAGQDQGGHRHDDGAAGDQDGGARPSPWRSTARSGCPGRRRGARGSGP